MQKAAPQDAEERARQRAVELGASVIDEELEKAQRKLQNTLVGLGFSLLVLVASVVVHVVFFGGEWKVPSFLR